MTGPKLVLALCAFVFSGAVWAGPVREASSQPISAETSPEEKLVFGEMKIARWLAETVVRAAQIADVDPAYVMALADKESSFSPQSRAATSSAEGLFQFLEGTWLELLNAHARKYGFDAVADAITVSAGRPTVTDPEKKRWILSLRRDPHLSALMACEMVKEVRQRLARQTDRPPTGGDLYLAHFLGSAGAARLLKLVAEKPQEKAPKVFPSAAKANQSIFFQQQAKKKEAATVAEVRARLDAIMEKRLQRYASVSVAGLPDIERRVP